MEGAELQRLIKKCRQLLKKNPECQFLKKKRNVSDIPITKGPYA
jgi:hypothetical protein